VDDLLITGNNVVLIREIKDELKKDFEMTDLGEMKYFLGMEVDQTKDGIFVCQKRYAKEMLKKFNMENCKSVNTPLVLNSKMMKDDGAKKSDEKVYRSLVGCLLYLTATRPDLMFTVNLLSRYRQEPSEIHFQAAKRVLRYIKGTEDYGISFTKSEKFVLTGFTDSDWAGSADDMKSTSGYAFYAGSSLVCWNSIKQKTVAQSTAEAEYIAATEATNQAIWLRKILNDLKHQQSEATTILCDNQSAVAIVKNPVFHGKTAYKHQVSLH
jgi:hypothetical protein